MRILLISIGTRGDMEPFIAIGEILVEKGHQVICAFPEQFRSLVDGTGMEFVSLGSEYIAILESDVGKTAMGGGSGSEKIIANIKLASIQKEINKKLTHKQYEMIEKTNPDRVLYNGKAIVPILWGINKQQKYILICSLPNMHPVRNQAHVAFHGNYGMLLNKLTYLIAEFGQVMTLKVAARWLKLSPKVSRKQLSQSLRTGKAIYTISPSLFQRPVEWGSHLQVLGYQHRKSPIFWEPGEDLIRFLIQHEKKRVLFISFGSMISPNPGEKTKMFLDILQQYRIPAIINIASGGFLEPDLYDHELVHFVTEIPYEWILPKVYGVIHHGGSGTTHLGLRSGCATMIIPHIIDQFVWNDIIDESGAGPKGISIAKITSDTLESKIRDLVRNDSFKQAAKNISDEMRGENFREEIHEAIVE